MKNQNKNINRLLPKAVFCEVKDAEYEAYLKEASKGICEPVFFKETAQEIKQYPIDTEILSVFIGSKVGPEIIARLPKLKFIATRSTGYDHIDLESASSSGVHVSNVPVYGENTVAEHTFALILSLSRNLRKAYLKVVQNDFSIDGLKGFDLKGKTLGVIGTGNIGLHVIRIAVSFGMNVIAFDTKQKSFLSEVLNFKYVSLEELLKESDIVTLHVPCLESTRHMINQDTIKLMKKHAILINTARGGLVDTESLITALDQDRLGGAGLDVLEEEELILEEKRLLNEKDDPKKWDKIQKAIKYHLLLRRENVIYTPHMAFYSEEAVHRILDTTLQNIRSFIEGRSQNVVIIDRRRAS